MLTFDESSGSALESMMVAAITGGTWSSFISLQPSAAFYDPAACSSPCALGHVLCGRPGPDASDRCVGHVRVQQTATRARGCATVTTCWNTFVGRYTFAGPAFPRLSPSSGPVPADSWSPSTVPTSNSAARSHSPARRRRSPMDRSLPTLHVHDAGVGTSGTRPGAGPGFGGNESNQSAPATSTWGWRTTCRSPHSGFSTRGPGIRACSASRIRRSDRTRPASCYLVGVPGLTDPIPSDSYRCGAQRHRGRRQREQPADGVSVWHGDAGRVQSEFRARQGDCRTWSRRPWVQGGAVNIYNAYGTVNVLADVEGYFEPDAATVVAGEFHPIAPTRVCDTRSTSSTPFCKAHGALGPGATMVVNVTGIGANPIPANGSAAAAVVNLTGVAGSLSTYLSLFPTNSSGQCVITGTSTLNLFRGRGGGQPGDGGTRACLERRSTDVTLRVQRGGHHQRGH